MRTFDLPDLLKPLVKARNALKEHYSAAGLSFTFDGKFVGDLAEAAAAEIYGLTLKSGEGIDAFTSDGRSVQIKASCTGRGPAYRRVSTQASHLLFLHLDLEACRATVVFNGPEHLALACLPQSWNGQQRMISLFKLRQADAKVQDQDRLHPIN